MFRVQFRAWKQSSLIEMLFMKFVFAAVLRLLILGNGKKSFTEVLSQVGGLVFQLLILLGGIWKTLNDAMF